MSYDIRHLFTLDLRDLDERVLNEQNLDLRDRNMSYDIRHLITVMVLKTMVFKGGF